MIPRKIAKTIYDKVYVKLFPDYRTELRKIVKGNRTLLDVGCGSNSPIKSFSHKLHTEGVDCFEPSIKKSQEKEIHNKYHKINLMHLSKKIENKSFDCVLASDVIEHFTKKEGEKLIEMIESIAKKKVIIYTPNGFLKQGEYDNNPWQVHKSGWYVKEMQKRGYKVIGIHGHKSLRKEYANLRYKPKFFWQVFSDITQLFTRNNPKYAFQILCVKKLK